MKKLGSLGASLMLMASVITLPSAASANPLVEECLRSKGCITDGSGAWLCPGPGDYEDRIFGN